jgi:hypothetical protein
MFKAAPWGGVFFPTEPELNPEPSNLTQQASKGTSIDPQSHSEHGLIGSETANPSAPGLTFSSRNNSIFESACLRSRSDPRIAKARVGLSSDTKVCDSGLAPVQIMQSIGVGIIFRI